MLLELLLGLATHLLNLFLASADMPTKAKLNKTQLHGLQPYLVAEIRITTQNFNPTRHGFLRHLSYLTITPNISDKLNTKAETMVS